MLAINKIPRGLQVLIVIVILALLVWKFALDTSYYYYSIGAAALIAIAAILGAYRKPAVTASKSNTDNQKILRKSKSDTGDSGLPEKNSEIVDAGSEIIPVEADYTDTPAILRNRPTVPFGEADTRPEATQVTLKYIQMAGTATKQTEALQKQASGEGNTALEQSETIKTAPIDQPPIPLIEDETTLTEEEANELMNAVWYRCENPYCKYTRFLGVHHILDEKDGGTNKLNNLIVLCPYCHDLAHRNEIPEKEMQDWISNREERFRFKPQWHYF